MSTFDIIAKEFLFVNSFFEIFLSFYEINNFLGLKLLKSSYLLLTRFIFCVIIRKART